MNVYKKKTTENKTKNQKKQKNQGTNYANEKANVNKTVILI